MTTSDLDKMESAMLSRLLPWSFKTGKLIRESIDDAKAHALNCLTARLKAEDDGRPTQRRLDVNRSFGAANDRIVTLGESLDLFIRDARQDFYVGSIKLWLPFIPEDVRIEPDPKPTAAGKRLARDAVIHGYSLPMELGPAIDTVKRTLRVACSIAGRGSVSSKTGEQRIALWASQATTGLIMKVDGILSDSDSAIHEATGWLLIDPKYRGQRLVDPEAGIHF